MFLTEHSNVDGTISTISNGNQWSSRTLRLRILKKENSKKPMHISLG
uniref:Uncharacterized protein n=1 Tax=Anguilla anguilla TaxID=7936 RepID=A0A0E9SB87_ANGAN